MAKLIEFIKNLVVKAGGNVNDEKIKAALELVNADIELQDELVTAIDHGLISIPNAKNNHPEIRSHYTALAYNGLDAEVDRFMEEEKLDAEVIAEIKNEKSSTKRAVLIARKIKELEAAKAGQGKAETKTLNEKIAELNGLLKTEKESINGIKADYEKKLRDKDKGYAMRNLLSTYTTIYDKLDPDTKNITVNAIIEKNLRAKGFEIDTDENGNLVLKTKDGSGAFGDDHTPLTAQKFLDKVMADEKLLVVSDSNNNNQNNNRNNNNNNSGGFNNRNNSNNGGTQARNNNNNQNHNNDGGGNRSSVLQDLIKKSQQDLTNSSGTNLF